jgi:glycerol uptake facilitator protein
VFAHQAIDLGVGQTSFNEDASTWTQAIFSEGIGTFMLMFAILGIVDTRSPSDLAGLVIGGVVIAIIMIVGPITGASLNPARAFGPELVSAIGSGTTHWNQLIPVYVLPGLVGAGLAAVSYDLIAKPRRVARPIHDAVTTPEGVPAPSAAAAS